MIRLIVGLALLLLPQPEDGSAQPRSTPTFDPSRIEAVVDSLAKAHVGGSKHIPGAVVSVVQGDTVTLATGYGWADVEAKRPADPDSTLFGIGSVTKLFTSTAAMRLVGTGRADLHADVNRYLDDVRVPDRFGEPITLHHLLTHTGGFENRFLGMAAPSAAAVRPLGDYLQDNLPARVRPPGTVASYSNHGMALAGHLVASVRDTTYAAALRQSVFEPLRMTHSTSSRALPDSLRGTVATAYRTAGDAFERRPLGHMHVAPAGAVLTTARDAARFMTAHLNGGRTAAGRVLRPETTRQMHTQHFTHHPALAGWAYGFFEHPRSSHRILMHGGGGNGFTALLWLVPEHDLGVFVAVNTNDDTLHRALLDALTTPPFDPPIEEQPTAQYPSKAAPSTWVGAYRQVRHAQTTPEKLLALTMVVDVAATDSGLVASGLASSPVQLRPLGDGRFQRSNGGTVVFDERHGTTYLFDDAAMAPAYERIPFWASMPVQASLVGGFVLVFLLTVVGAVWRWRDALASERRLAATVGGLHFAFIVGFALVVGLSPAGPVFFTGPTLSMKAVLALPLLALAATAALAVRTAQLWTSDSGRAWVRAGLSFLVLASAAFGLLLHHWNLLGWSF